MPIPLRLDGSKKPVGEWDKYKIERPTEAEVTEWFARPAGIGVVLGIVSGGAECIDFEAPEYFPPIYDNLPTERHRLLSVYETPTGWQVIYRCSEVFNATKLARRPDKSTLIETCGEGSHILAEGSPLATHASGMPYCHYMGPRLESLGTITPTQRRELWRLCSACDQTGEPTPAQKPVNSSPIAQAKAYLSKMEPAVQGSNGGPHRGAVCDSHRKTC